MDEIKNKENNGLKKIDVGFVTDNTPYGVEEAKFNAMKPIELTNEQKLAVADFMFPRHPKGIELVDDLTDEAKDWALRRILGLAEARPLEQKLDLGDNLLPCDKPAVPRLKPLEGGKIPRIPDDVLVKLKEKEKEILLTSIFDDVEDSGEFIRRNMPFIMAEYLRRENERLGGYWKFNDKN